MSLEQKDLELIERIVYKNGDDIAVSVARSFERIEERIDGAESRLYSRFADIEEKIEEEAGGIIRSLTKVSDSYGGLAADLKGLRAALPKDEGFNYAIRLIKEAHELLERDNRPDVISWLEKAESIT